METVAFEGLEIQGSRPARERDVGELVRITANVVMRPRILLVDSDAGSTAGLVRRALPGFELDVARSAAEGARLFRGTRPDVVLLESHLPDGSGLELHQELRTLDARVPAIFLTGDSGADAAIAAMKSRAFDYLYKPFELQQIRNSVLEALQVSRSTREAVPTQSSISTLPKEATLLGTSPSMLEVYKAIGRVAAQDVTVLISGESGTGKELVARAIQQHSARSKAAYSALNCAAIPESLLEAELFGHEKGAFTGAYARRVGRFEHHSGGTLLLDEIGDMPMSLQAKVLRLVQDQSFQRAGGNETVSTDVRLIAATHHDLPSLVEDGRFRLDLYHRLSTFTIHVPALRERGSDIELLAKHFVARFSRELGREVREIASDALAELRGYSWPGNVRQLQNVLKHAVLRAHGSTLLRHNLPALVPAAAPRRTAQELRAGDAKACDLERFVTQKLREHDPSDLHAQTRDYVERFLFKAVLERVNGNCQRGARLLGISRQTMRTRLRALGLSVGHRIEDGDEALHGGVEEHEGGGSRCAGT